MYLLYLDESGNESDPNDQYFVLAGIALFERQTYYLSDRVEAIQEKYFPNHQPITFHLTDIRARKGFWRKQPEAVGQAVIKDLTDVIVTAPDQGRLLYAAAIEKNATLWREQAVEAATEQICQRFDNFLTRSHHEEEYTERITGLRRGAVRQESQTLGSQLPPTGDGLGGYQQPRRHSLFCQHAGIPPVAVGRFGRPCHLAPL